MLLIGGGLQL